MSISLFEQWVATRYHIYNSLFLNLPFQHIYRTGTLLPLLHQYVEKGFEKELEPRQIIEQFFEDYLPNATVQERNQLLFNFIQYTERQVVLFDSVEDAAFEKLHDLNGKGTLKTFFATVADDRKQSLRTTLEQFSLRVVLTAHPTQFYPGNVLAILNDLELAIRQGDLSEINGLLQQLGKTPFLNREKPTPLDEAMSLGWYLENVFYEAIPSIMQKVLIELDEDAISWQNFDLIKIGFWPGGDRDGNPFVTHEITLQVAHRLKSILLRKYHRDIRKLKRRLTFKGVFEIIQQIEYRISSDFPDAESYPSSDEFLKDLLTARQVLVSEHSGLFVELLDLLIIKVRLFGFYLASLDIRQDSRTHQLVMDLLCDQKVELDSAKLSALDPKVQETLATIQTIQQIQQANGEKACHRYIISNCGSAKDVQNVFAMLKLVWKNEAGIPVDIIPLFESIDDLAEAHNVMEELYSNLEYREHLKQRGQRQTIMLGFSDGTKDGGYLQANWSIFKAKEQLTSTTRKFGVTALFFDGRGGPPARGGGSTHDFYASLPNTIENAEVQITIQGQTISSNFGKEVSCRYNLEQMLSAGLGAAVNQHPSTQLNAAERELIDNLARDSYQSYMQLRRHQEFVPYLENATPLRFFGETNIASRPTKRNSESLKFEDLRAIPFVGSWAQMKQNIPGFYGVGSAIATNLDSLEALKILYKKSLFFRTLLNNSMMALSKTNYALTRYLERDEQFSELWTWMKEEQERSKRYLLEVSEQQNLMDKQPLNRDSVALREKIVLPLVAIQQYALQLHRENKEKKMDPVHQQLILRCMFGIINAARNSA